jgi:hypothetical protein
MLMKPCWGCGIYERLPDMNVVANLELVVVADGMGDIFDVLLVFAAVDGQAWEFLALHQVRSWVKI